jgi:CRP-like cAMP-binding protein
MGLLDGRTDSATVIATEPSQVLLITEDVYVEFFLENKRKLLQVIDILCSRLRESWLFHTIIGINNADSKIKATLAHYSKTLGIKGYRRCDHQFNLVAPKNRRPRSYIPRDRNQGVEEDERTPRN